MTERRLGLTPGFLDDQIERASQLSLDEINAFIRGFYDPALFTMLRAVPEIRKKACGPSGSLYHRDAARSP
jgi:hypothetical protein